MSAFRRTPKWFLPSLLLAALVLQGYGIFRFKSQRDGLLDQKQGLEKKQAVLEKKYAEEKRAQETCCGSRLPGKLR